MFSLIKNNDSIVYKYAHGKERNSYVAFYLTPSALEQCIRSWFISHYGCEYLKVKRMCVAIEGDPSFSQ